ncbi:uncharacterized protein LOC131939651 isoform X2 [Physella acuta]|nr:uncharacterized protein LOC131939651 isoform X2 [Physella acuta]XP_059154082.1 uncharacterized protein LOC131939651 isoform X2 [Physella acuta]
MAYCFLRSLITLLHVTTGLAAGFICVYSLLGWDSAYWCFPGLFGGSRTTILGFLNDQQLVCDGVLFALGGVCVMNLMMSLTINFCWASDCIAYLHLVMSLLFGALMVFGGGVFTYHYMMWCDSMERVTNIYSCTRAASTLFSANGTSMTTYKRMIEIQQITIWSLFPVTFFTVLAYVLALRLTSRNGRRVRTGSYVLVDDEGAPLIDPRRHSRTGRVTVLTRTHAVVSRRSYEPDQVPPYTEAAPPSYYSVSSVSSVPRISTHNAPVQTSVPRNDHHDNEGGQRSTEDPPRMTPVFMTSDSSTPNCPTGNLINL